MIRKFIALAILSLALAACQTTKTAEQKQAEEKAKNDAYVEQVLEQVFGPAPKEPEPPKPVSEYEMWEQADFACVSSGLVTLYQRADGLFAVLSTLPHVLLSHTTEGTYEGRDEGRQIIRFMFFKNGSALFDHGFLNDTCRFSTYRSGK